MHTENINKKYILLFFLISLIGYFTINHFISNDRFMASESCALSINRFEQDFFNIEVDSFDILFPAFKDKYQEFFIDTMIDVKKEVFLDDTLRSILDSVDLVFSNTFPGINQLHQGYCNYITYFPNSDFSMYTFIDKSFDYRTPVVYASQKLYVSLHLFLGQNHSFYSFLPDYIKHAHDTMFLASSCFLTLAGRHIPYPELDSFLANMLHYSKAHCFTKAMIPNIQDYQLFKHTVPKMEWCSDHESAIWAYMVEKDYLFSSSSDLVEKFISLAPFSQFGLPADRESPGSIGVWLGFQIWQSYIKTNKLNIIDILNETDYIKVLNRSGYKP